MRNRYARALQGARGELGTSPTRPNVLGRAYTITDNRAPSLLTPTDVGPFVAFCGGRRHNQALPVMRGFAQTDNFQSHNSTTTQLS